MSVAYEWIVEQVDKNGDIIDTSAWDTCAAASMAMKTPLTAGLHYDYGITRNEGGDDVGLQERAWCYVSDGALPSTFDDGRVVPARFRREFNGELAAIAK